MSLVFISHIDGATFEYKLRNYYSKIKISFFFHKALAHFWGNKVSMLEHTYPHKPQMKIRVTIYSHQAESLLFVWPDVWSGDLQVYKSIVIHDTECPFWDQVSLNNTNQTKSCNVKKVLLHMITISKINTAPMIA